MKQLLKALGNSRWKLVSSSRRPLKALEKKASRAELDGEFGLAAQHWRDLWQMSPRATFQKRHHKALKQHRKMLEALGANGQPDRAVALGDRFLAQYGDEPGTLEVLALLEQRRGRFTSAARLWLSWQRFRPSVSPKRYLEAYQGFVHAGMAAQAGAMLDEAERLGIPRQKVLQRRARLLESLHCWSEAQRAWAELLQIEGARPALEARRLLCLLEIDPTRAEAELNAISDREKEQYDLFKVRVRLAQKRLDWNAAFVLCQHAVQLFPDQDSAWHGLAHAHISRLELDEAERICRTRLSETGKVTYRFVLVEALLQARRVDEAARELEAVDPNEGDASKLAELRAKSLQLRGQDLKAARLLEGALDERRGNIKPLIALALLYIRAQRYDEAHRVAGWIAPDFDSRNDVAELRAWQSAEQGDIAAARAQWTPSVRASIPSLRPLDAPLQPNKPVPPPAGLQLFAFFRNERVRLPYFLDYYRALGVERFYLVDNGSTDGSSEDLAGFNDVIVFRTEDSYREAVSGMRWINHLVRRFGGTGWALHVDLDEFLVLPGIEGQDLSSHIAYLESNDYEAVRAFMLDMYPESDDASKVYRIGDNPLSYCPYFDNNYRFYGAMRAPYQWVEGGVRERLFLQYDLYLCKTPLIRAGRGIDFLASSHFVSPVSVADMSAVLLHYKFLGAFKSRIAEEADRLEYSNSAKNLKHLNSYLARNRDRPTWIGPDTERYSDSYQLVAMNLLDTGRYICRKAVE